MCLGKAIFLFIPALLSTSASADMMSVFQDTWHGGPDSAAPCPGWEFSSTFLEEDNITWLSVSRLTLEYPAMNELIDSLLPNSSLQTEAADFTENGFPDLVIASTNPDGNVYLLENPGVSSSEEWPLIIIASSFLQCRSVSSGDIDGDGDTDIVLGCFGTRGISWLENNGAQGIWLFHQVGSTTGITSVDCEDMDQDGDVDILFCSAATDTLGWMSNLNGTGDSWQVEGICTTLNYPFYACITDIDSDGIPDVSACYKISNKVYWYSRNSSDNSWAQHNVASVTNAACVSAGDINGDSFVDLVVCGQSSNSVYLCTNITGSGTSWDVQNLELDAGWTGSCIVADIDDDGYQDIAVTTKTDNIVTVLSNTNGSGDEFFQTDFHAVLPVFCCTIDADQDGTSELACLCRNELRLLDSSPGSFPEEGNLTSAVVLVPCETDNEWGNITWDSWEPSGTEISFQVRNSDDPASMGEWSDTITVNGTYLGDLFTEVKYYIQYRAILSSDSPDATPFLYSVDLQGYKGDVCDYSEAIADIPLITVDNNPSLEYIALTVNPSNTMSKLRIYDVSGRLVQTLSYEPDNDSVQDTIEGLSFGVYHIIATAGNRRETLKVCVVR